MNSHLTQLADLTEKEILNIISSAQLFKKKHDAGEKSENLLQGKVVAMVFEKPSLRTKVAFETATALLGGTPVFLTAPEILASGQNMQGRESIPDIAKNLERFADLIIARVYNHKTITTIAESINIPVINALCNFYHPTQALADIMAILWHKKTFSSELKVSFIGDGNNVATSLMHVCAKLGISFCCASPVGYEIPKNEQEKAKKIASAALSFSTNPQTAAQNANVIYTDTFISMGQENETKTKLSHFTNFQVTKKLLSLAKKDVLFMHCLPAHRGEEVTNEVMDSNHSIVFDQAECRLHIAKALLSFYLI